MGIDGPAGYTEWAASAGLRSVVACTWTGGVVPAAPDPDPEPVLPDGCTDIIWDGASAFVAGPDTGPSSGGASGGVVVGIRLRPGAAPGVLGLPADALRDRRVPLAELWPDASELEDRLAACATTQAMAEQLERVVARRLARADQAEPDPVVAYAARAWARDPTAVSIPQLGNAAGVGERQLHRRFTAAAGYGPKVLQRVLRLQRFLQAATTTDAGLADLAARAGYADQAHLTREAQALAGRTPAQLAARRR